MVANSDKTAVILLSGGIDSATTAAYAMSKEYDLHAITFFYDQKHSIEIEFAKRIIDFLKIEKHITIEIPSVIFASSALSNVSEIDVPKDHETLNTDHIPVTYVPGRNILFLSYAISYAETIGSRDIFFGANSIDYSGYPDCRPEFIQAFENMANIGTKAGIMGDRFTIHTPLILLKKSDIIKLGHSLGLDYSVTHSCYDPYLDGSSCGRCDSCIIRKNGFRDAGIPDPTKYRVD